MTKRTIACFLFLWAIHSTHHSMASVPNTDPKLLQVIDKTGRTRQSWTEEQWCGGVTEIPLAEERAFNPARATGPTGPEEWKPLVIRYIFTWKQGEQSNFVESRLIDAARYINDEKLGPIIKTDRLKDDRKPRIINKDTGNCRYPVTCGRNVIPDEYVMPCYKTDGQYVHEPNVPKEPSESMRESRKSSAIVYLYLKSEQCKKEVAHTVICEIDEVTQRATHAAIVICIDLVVTLQDEINVILLHETLHLLTGGNLAGLLFKRVPFRWKDATTGKQLADAAKGLTWNMVTYDWMTEDGEQTLFNTTIAITERVKGFVQQLYSCPSLEGAEMAIKQGAQAEEKKVDESHWSFRLYPDEILSPGNSKYKALSNLTLGFLQDSGAFAVDMSEAEPLEYSRPDSDIGCTVATKSCHKIFSDASREAPKVRSLGPYCDPEGRVITSLCSENRFDRLSCRLYKVGGNGCYIRVMAWPVAWADDDYNNPRCWYASTAPNDITQLGWWTGQYAICVTMHNLTTSTRHLGLYAICTASECDQSSKSLTVYNFRTPGLSPVERCSAWCPSDAHNTMQRFYIQTPEGTKTDKRCSGNAEALCPKVKSCYGGDGSQNRQRTTPSDGDRSVSMQFFLVLAFFGPLWHYSMKMESGGLY